MPQYYICFFLTLLLMDGANYLNKEQLPNIISHIFFVHNLHPDFHGTINGVLWTMGVIAQFYILAIPLYRWIKKNVFFMGICCIGGTVIIKAFVYAVVLTSMQLDTSIYFFAGRQILTALDNFTAGMAVAYLIEERKLVMKSWQGWTVFLVSIVGLYFVCVCGLQYGIHTNNLSGYLWHSMLALTLAGIMTGSTYIRLDNTKKICRILLWVAKYEYGIYLWHLILILNLIERAPVIAQLKERGHFFAIFAVFLVLSIFLGYLMTSMTDFICVKCKHDDCKNNEIC